LTKGRYCCEIKVYSKAWDK